MTSCIRIYANTAKVKNLTVIFIVSATTPRLLHLSGVPHVYFPPYSKEESIQILSLDLPIIFTRPVDESYDYGDEEEAEDRAWLWPKYCSVVWDSMGKAAARDLRSFKSLCNKLWRPFVQPIIDGQFGTRDFSKLLVSRKSVFQNESALSGTSMTGQQNIQSKTASKRPGKFATTAEKPI
jgi:origin recognition complex subunit 5